MGKQHSHRGRAAVRLARIAAAALALVTVHGATSAPTNAEPAEAQRYIVVLRDEAVRTARSTSEQTGSAASDRRARGYDPDRIDAQVGRLQRAMRLEPTNVFRSSVAGFAATLTTRQLRELRGDPAVAAVEPDLPVRLDRQAHTARDGGT